MTGGDLLRLDRLSVTYRTQTGAGHAVRDVSMSIRSGEILGVVGESGSGKSSTFLAAMGLLKAGSATVSGQALFDGLDLVNAEEHQLRRIRGRRIAMIFQDALSCLHPMRTVGSQIAEVLQIHGVVGRAERAERTIEVLRQVGMPSPESRAREYPHQLSGGMNQRVMIAMALVANPSVIIADEPTTALDVTVQAQILDLLEQIRETSDTAIVLITHDLAVIAERADRAIVMYGGRVVEEAAVEDLFRTPHHPYTLRLLEAVPRADRKLDADSPIRGRPPSSANLPPGCSFHPRCDLASSICREVDPALETVRAGHQSACHHIPELLGLKRG